jgi:RNA polymerase sigma-70 factor (ECF subfamily)
MENVNTDREMTKAEITSLVEEAKKQNYEALSKLSTYYYPKIYRHMLYKVNNREDAEDLASEVFVRMVKSLQKQKGSFNAWLYKIANNLAIDYYRKKSRKKEVSLVEEFEDHAPVQSDETEKILEREDLDKAISTLPDDQRQTILLKFMEGYSNKEIANILGKTVGAVKALQFRALNNLKAALQEEE